MLYSYQKEYFAGCQYDNICIGCIGAINLPDINLVSCTVCKHSVNHVFSSPTSIINFTSKKPSYDDTRRSGRDNELLQRAQNDL